ncbi:MAG: hypothetical protein Q8P33_03400 [bacterium]|nr:hypothetical protein [bacterium]
MSKGFAISGFILSLIALAIAVTLLVLNLTQDDDPAGLPVNNAPLVDTLDDPHEIPEDFINTGDVSGVADYSGWATYTSAHGQTLRYPEGWTLSNTSIDDYATLAEAIEVSGAHFAVEHVTDQSVGVEGPSVWRGGGAKVEVFVQADVFVSLDDWVAQSTAEAQANSALFGQEDDVISIELLTINGVAAQRVTYTGGIYGGGSNVTYLIKDGYGYSISIYSEDSTNPPQDALDVVGSFAATL